MKKQYRITYDKWFALSNPITTVIDGKLHTIEGASITIEYRTFDKDGNEIFYTKKEEKAYNIADRKIYENNFTRAYVNDQGITIETTDIAKVLQSMTNHSVQWKIDGWYLDARESAIINNMEVSLLTPIRVTEGFFNTFVKNHIAEFKNSTNIDAQNTCVGWKEVK